MSAVSTSRAIDGLPSAIVQTDTAVLNDERIGCILVGPGLGDMPQVLTLALTAPRPIVIDADAIGLVGEPERLRGHDTILTPHEGEFAKLFGEIAGSKADTRAGSGSGGRSPSSSTRGRTRWWRRPTAGSVSRRLRRHGSPAPEQVTCWPVWLRRCAPGAWKPSKPPAPQSGCMAALPRLPGRR